jgi:hypothetical protein
LFCSIGVNLNSIPPRVCIFEQAGESCAIFDARIKSRELGWKREPSSEPLGFDGVKRDKAEFAFAREDAWMTSSGGVVEPVA